MTKTIVIKDGATNSSYIRLVKKEYYEECEGYLELSFVECIIQIKRKILWFNVYIDVQKWSTKDDPDESWCEFQAKEIFDNIVYPFKNRMFLK